MYNLDYSYGLVLNWRNSLYQMLSLLAGGNTLDHPYNYCEAEIHNSFFMKDQNMPSDILPALTLDAVQVSGGQRLSLALVCGDTLVLCLLGSRHVARTSALLQVVAAAGGGHPAQRYVLRWP